MILPSNLKGALFSVVTWLHCVSWLTSQSYNLYPVWPTGGRWSAGAGAERLETGVRRRECTHRYQVSGSRSQLWRVAVTHLRDSAPQTVPHTEDARAIPHSRRGSAIRPGWHLRHGSAAEKGRAALWIGSWWVAQHSTAQHSTLTKSVTLHPTWQTAGTGAAVTCQIGPRLDRNWSLWKESHKHCERTANREHNSDF